MAPQLANPLDLSALKQIHTIASSLSEFLLKSGRVSECQEPSAIIESSIPPFDPLFPPEILDPIDALIISDGLRRALLQRIGRLMKDLQDQYIMTYRETCLATLKGPDFLQDLTAINEVYHSIFARNCVPMVEAQIATIIGQVTKYQQSNDHSTRKPFNNDYLPMLEQYFKFNGYPSTAHRLILAQKSMMLPRQIEVWFQNHRNRAKKEYKSVPRLDNEIPLRRALEILQQSGTSLVHQHRLATPPYEEPASMLKKNTESTQRPTVQTSPQALSLSLSTNLADIHESRPPHAYPSTRNNSYPDPFPTENGVFKFPPPMWRRRPATSPIVPTVVDMDEFASTFHLKLNFAERSRRPGTTIVKPDPSSITPWFSSTTIFAPSAPHPALVITKHIPETVSSIPDFSLTDHITKPIFGLSSLVRPTTPPLKKLPRKTRPLPRRIPRSRSNSSGSRTSSFSSDVSIASRISSSSSDYSSPELPTPPSLPHVDLPFLQDGIQQQDLFDFSHTDSDTNYSHFLPPQHFGLADVYPVSTKLPDISFFDAFPDFSHNLGQILS